MYIESKLQERWDRFLAVSRPGLIEALSIQITEIKQGFVKASMPVTDTVKQPFGMLHGGASVTLAETVASLGSYMLLDSESGRISGIEINANHLRPVSKGSVSAEAAIMHQGRLIHVWQINITDQQNLPVCVGRCTIAINP